MESSNLSSTPPDDGILEMWLRTNGRLPDLPDHGFTRRVLTALPVPDHRYLNRWWWCLTGLVLGGMIALVGMFAPGNTLSDTGIVALQPHLFTPASLLALAVATGSLAYAFLDKLNRLLRF